MAVCAADAEAKAATAQGAAQGAQGAAQGTGRHKAAICRGGQNSERPNMDEFRSRRFCVGDLGGLPQRLEAEAGGDRASARELEAEAEV